MDTIARIGRWWEGPKQHWVIRLLENLRSELTWRDALIGCGAVLILSGVLVGFRFQYIPDYKTGQIASEDLRAFQDVVYEDRAATALKRAEAENEIPALYQLESDLIVERKKILGAALSEARAFLAANSASPNPKPVPVTEQELSSKLEARFGKLFPQRVLSVLMRQSFSPVLESRMLKILDTVLHDGIVGDIGQFLKDQRTGIVIRDGSYPFEHRLAATSMVRDLSAAREYLSQFRLDFSELSQREQAILLQYLESSLFPTLIYRKAETESRRTAAAQHVPPVTVQIKQGQTLVRRGEPLTQHMILQLNALKSLHQPRSLVLQFAGYFILISILIYSVWRFLVHYQGRHKKIRNHMVLILVIFTFQLIVIRLMTAMAEIFGERFQRFQNPSELYYAIPFAFGALLTTLLVDVNLGILASIFLSITVGLYYGDIYLAAYLFIGSLAGIYSIRQYKDRAAILKAGLTIGIVNLLCLAGFAVLRQASFSVSDALDQLVLGLLGGILASTMASMLLPALEYFFKIVTDIRLLELSNLNAPILRRLSVEAPGTYHHSLMVATLAEAAAEATGANPLLVRVAAYYHDVGKLLKPEYFVENQAYGINKHEELSPALSCVLISGHVRDGLQLAKEIALPQLISDVIPQHHGTRVMTYFFQKAKDGIRENQPGVAEADFRYAGPKPQSKESAIMMMADSVEAASRTLSDPTPAQIQGMIDRLIEGILNDHQFDECDITLKEVRIVKESFFIILTGIFHHRIDYPGYDFKNTGDQTAKAAAQNPGPESAKTIQD
jgi:cyclic-di-AMP phosphodiesterase PgpH